MAIDLIIDWFDVEIQVPEEVIGTSSQNMNHVDVPI